MRETKLALLFAGAALLGMLSGCAPGQSEPETAEPVEETAQLEEDDRLSDEDFVAAAGRALEARWDVAAEYTAEELADMTASEYQAYLLECVSAEQESLGSVTDYLFHDTDLADVVARYYYALELQRSGAVYARTDSLTEYNDTWVLGYYNRVSAVYDLHSRFGLQVDERYEPALAEFIAPWYTAKKQAAFREFETVLPGLLHYELDAERSRGEELYYSAVFENTTGYTIGSITILVNCYDADGVVTLQTSDRAANLKPGESYRSTINTGEVEFTGMECFVTIDQ